VQTIERELAQEDRVSQRQSLIPVSVASSLTRLFSGIANIAAPTGHAKELAIRITPEGGAPLTITSMTPIVQEAGR
jgi:archaellin